MNRIAIYMVLVVLSLLLNPLSGQAVGAVWPQPPQQARIQFVESISHELEIAAPPTLLKKLMNVILGVAPQSSGLVRPISAKTDSDGSLFVTDPGARCVHKFDRTRKKYRKISRIGDHSLESPVGIAIANKDLIFISDSKLGEVFAMNGNGKYLFRVSGDFIQPTGLCIYDDRLYVVDTQQHELLVFDLDGVFLYEIGGRGVEPGKFNYPIFVAAASNLVISDAMNFRIQTLDEEHAKFRIFGENGDVQGTFARPKGVAVDSDGHIYVTDGLFDAFQIFDQQGQLLLVVGSTGFGPGEFNMPTGIFIDKKDRIYVVDTMNRRVQIFQYLKDGA